MTSHYHLTIIKNYPKEAKTITKKQKFCHHMPQPSFPPESFLSPAATTARFLPGSPPFFSSSSSAPATPKGAEMADIEEKPEAKVEEAPKETEPGSPVGARKRPASKTPVKTIQAHPWKQWLRLRPKQWKKKAKAKASPKSAMKTSKALQNKEEKTKTTKEKKKAKRRKKRRQRKRKSQNKINLAHDCLKPLFQVNC